MEVTVVIVSWNAQNFIKQCLDSVFCQEEKDIEVIVVDNGSTDDTVNIVRGYLPHLQLIENKENKGFCFANNQAILISKGRYIFTLNSDMMLEKNYISTLKSYLEKHERVGMCQGKSLRRDKKTIDGLGLYIGMGFRFHNIAEGKKDNPGFDSDKKIFGVCAAAALYDRKLLEEIRYKNEYFDEDFFFLVEDFDIAWRARNKGWQARYVPHTVCYHYRGSSQHKLLYKQYLTFRNRYYLLIKNAAVKDVFFFIPVFFIYDLPRLFFLFLTNPYTLKACFELICSIESLMKKRTKG